MSSEEILFRGLINLATLVTGAVFLSLHFGWEVGVGVALLTAYHKDPERIRRE
jgi:hypothetical protein